MSPPRGRDETGILFQAASGTLDSRTRMPAFRLLDLLTEYRS